MKRYLINILLFFCIVAVIDLSVGLLGDYLQAHAKGGDTRTIDDLVENDKHDILIFGSSRAHSHYDTPFLSDTLSLDVYNAGYDGNGIVLSYGLLEMILERYKPSLILYDVEPSFDIYQYDVDNNNKRYIRNLRPYCHNKSISKLLRDISFEESCKVRSGLMRYNSSLVSIGLDFLLPRKMYKNGYKPKVGVYQGEISKFFPLQKIDSFKIECLENFLDLAKENNVPIAVVASPKYSLECPSELQPVKDLCEKMDVHFWNFYSDSTFLKHKEWFVEPMHLNSEGARAFSCMLVDSINIIIQQEYNE